VVHAHNHQLELGLPGWAKIRSMNPEGRWTKYARTPPWKYGTGWRLGLIPMPTEDEDGDIVSWALRPDTNGGMFSVGNDGTFSQDPVLSATFTPSPNTRRQSPRRRAEEEETGDEEERRKRQRTELATGNGSAGNRQRAKANRRAQQVFVATGKTREEWAEARWRSWPYPRWRL
jgi:hypothetical protein